MPAIHGRWTSERRTVIEAIPGWSGQGTSVDLLAPSLAGDERFRRWSAWLNAWGMLKGGMALRRMNGQIDIRDTLPVIRVPTLVLHRTG